ncbi:hypothetical protein LPAF129_11600 [Ligilactobacillus pabuli]|uniref:Lipoprotein n=1 Tax=Ligilactobacillus pabuli TaxID=2886039 RepID=A0ABQ5JHB9_9LACO|nr:DUF1307 domain-containing protein [Ligilactobacillus pabuli]GKS81474.1 hypothetical protein LPAF129_11600 [Ligilactobacillus pabuli]HIW89521.1 DUF1307 domain-containing protein [Candidatus Ligilactobacillus excrementipullorum]
MKVKKMSIRLVQVLFALGAMLLIVAGCTPKTEHTSFQKIGNGSDSRVTYYYQKDKVVKQTTANKITYATLRVNNNAEAKKAVKSTLKKYNDTKGVTDKITYHDSYLDEKVTVDLSKASVKDFLKLAGTNSSTDSDKKAKFISFEKSEKLIKKQGFTKIEDGKFKSLPKADLKVKKAISMDQFNSIKLAKDKQAGTTVDELTKEFGKPDNTSEGSASGSYTWYTNYTKTGYVRVSTNDKKEATSKFLLQPSVENKKFTPEKYDAVNKEISQDELLDQMGAPYQVQMTPTIGLIYYITKDESGQNIKGQYLFEVRDGKVVGKQAKE